MGKQVAQAALVMVGIPILAALLSLIVNAALFSFGPWADVWVVEVWIGLTAAGALIAWLTRHAWFTSREAVRVEGRADPKANLR
ncbi:MAG: hypothetical protein QM804_04355 [Propionicimonas sp.]